MLENPYASSDPPELSLMDQIEFAFDEIHRSIQHFNKVADLSPADHLRVVQLGQLVVNRFSTIRYKAREHVDDDKPF